jgi:hypothetical protein
MRNLSFLLVPLILILIIPLSACSGAATTPPAPTQSIDTVVGSPVAPATPMIATDGTSGNALGGALAGNPQVGAPPSGNPPSGAPGGAPPSSNPPVGAPPSGNPPVGAPPSGNPPSGAPGGVPPSGNPPSGAPGGAPGGVPPAGNPPSGAPGGAPGASSSSANLAGAYTVDGKTATQTGQTYAASKTDQSAIYVLNKGNLTLKNATIKTSGGSSSSDASSFYGLNAGVLAATASEIHLSDSTVTTTGDGANGVFATGSGSSVAISNAKINCTGQYAHAVMATVGGMMTVINTDMNTAGASSGAIATDRGGGTIRVTGGTVTTSGSNAPGIYSTGSISVTNAKISSAGSEAAVIEGANSITLTDTSLTSTKEGKWGVMIYQSFSGDAEGNKGTFNMTGGALAYTSKSGPLFYVNNTTGTITLSHVDVSAASGTLVHASAGDWGNSGSNGGNVILIADKQSLTGNLVADKISTIALKLQNGSTLTGAINAAQSAQAANLTLDASSNWNVTADSYLTTLNDSGGISGSGITNIKGNGHTVYYRASQNPSLEGKTFALSGGGSLQPAK